MWKRLFHKNKWKTPPLLLGGSSPRRWNKDVHLSERSAFDRARFGKYDRPGFGYTIFKWLIRIAVLGLIGWFLWASLPAWHLFN